MAAKKTKKAVKGPLATGRRPQAQARKQAKGSKTRSAKPVAKKAGVSKPVTAKAVSAKALSAITPLEDRIVVTVNGPSETTAGGIIIPGSVASRPSRGTVLAKGRGKRNKKGQLRPLEVEVGDEVLFGEYAGTKLTLEGDEVLILREEEILGLVEK